MFQEAAESKKERPREKVKREHKNPRWQEKNTLGKKNAARFSISVSIHRRVRESDAGRHVARIPTSAPARAHLRAFEFLAHVRLASRHEN